MKVADGNALPMVRNPTFYPKLKTICWQIWFEHENFQNFDIQRYAALLYCVENAATRIHFISFEKSIKQIISLAHKAIKILFSLHIETIELFCAHLLVHFDSVFFFFAL